MTSTRVHGGPTYEFLLILVSGPACSFYCAPVPSRRGDWRTITKVRKTPGNCRTSYTYCADDGTPLTTIFPGMDGVTEVNIQLLHQLDDAEVRSNLRYLRPNYDAWLEQRKAWTVEFTVRFTQENGRAPYEYELESATDIAFPKNWLLSIDQIAGEFDDAADCQILSVSSRPEPASPAIERLHEVVASMPDSWQEIYQKHIIGGWKLTEIASQRGVGESAIRKTMKKIESTIRRDEKLQKFYQRGAFSA